VSRAISFQGFRACSAGPSVKRTRRTPAEAAIAPSRSFFRPVTPLSRRRTSPAPPISPHAVNLGRYNATGFTR